MKMIKTSLLGGLLLLTLVASSQEAVHTASVQPVGPEKGIDNFTKYFSLIFTIGTVIVGVMQLYIAHKIGRVEHRMDQSIGALKAEINTRIDTETDKIYATREQKVEKMEARFASKEDLRNLREIIKMGIEKMELQIRLQKPKNV